MNSNRKHHFEWLTIALSVFLAWLPLLGQYTFVYDDYYQVSFLNNGILAYFVDAYEKEGIWRIFGLFAISLSLQSSWLFTVAMMLLHSAACCLFFEISCVLLRQKTTALFLAILMAAYPWSHQCFWWASACHYPLSTLLLLLVIFLFVRRYSVPARQTEGFWVTFLLTIVCLLVFEGLAFAAMAAGSCLWLQGRSSSLSATITRMRTHYSAWGPVLAGSLCLISIYLTQPPKPWKPIDFNPETLLSSVYYQYTNFLALSPLMSPQGRVFMFWNWQTLNYGVAVVLTLSLSWLVIRKSGAITSRRTTSQAFRRILPYVLVLLVAAGASYSLGGGFSLDARKKYPFVPLLLWIVGGLGLHIKRRISPRAAHFVVRVSPVVLLTVLFVGVAATWTTLGMIRYELHRFDSLVNYIKAEDITGNVNLESSVDTYSIWPSMNSQIGWEFDDAHCLTAALGPRALQCVNTGPDSTSTRLFYDAENAVWTRLPAHEQRDRRHCNDRD